MLAAASSIHTVKWANGLCSVGHDVHLISQHQALSSLSPAVNTYTLPCRGLIGYLCMVPAVRKLLSQIKPDIVNAHYATGYGTTAWLTGFHPCIISVWGSDVYAFPEKSYFHKMLLRAILYYADAVASTSVAMANQVRNIAPKANKIAVTPFGVDFAMFRAREIGLVSDKLDIVIGTVKTMSPTYGISDLIKAFSILVSDMQSVCPGCASRLRLRLVGEGSQVSELKQLVCRLGLSGRVDFVGYVDHADVPAQLHKLDIYVALSLSESFGVAVIEASASGIPVIVSDAGGLPEVTVDGVTGFIVPSQKPSLAAMAMKRLVLDHQLRISMGNAGRLHAFRRYEWWSCVHTLVRLYNDVLISG